MQQPSVILLYTITLPPNKPEDDSDEQGGDECPQRDGDEVRLQIEILDGIKKFFHAQMLRFGFKDIYYRKNRESKLDFNSNSGITEKVYYSLKSDSLFYDTSQDDFNDLMTSALDIIRIEEESPRTVYDYTITENEEGNYSLKSESEGQLTIAFHNQTLNLLVNDLSLLLNAIHNLSSGLIPESGLIPKVKIPGFEPHLLIPHELNPQRKKSILGETEELQVVLDRVENFGITDEIMVRLHNKTKKVRLLNVNRNQRETLKSRINNDDYFKINVKQVLTDFRGSISATGKYELVEIVEISRTNTQLIVRNPERSDRRNND